VTSIILQVAPFMAGFLCLLNVVFAYAFRKKRMAEILSYIVVGVLEVGIFVFVLGLRLSLIHRVPFHIPNYLPFTRTEIGAALTIGLGLFPAAYWHRTSAAQIRSKIAEDAKAIKEQKGGVHVRSNTPGEWMN